jgi:tetratricopeptide (TPR) repeat protein
MKYLVPLLLAMLSLNACADENAPTDLETNKYYSDYLKIYENYDSLGNEITLRSLNTYLDIYPERSDAYIFKGYIVCKMGRYDEGQQYFKYAKSLDSLNVKTYEYQSAFMLYDTTKQQETRDLIVAGFAADDSSSMLMNNLAWLNLLEGNPIEALNNVNEGITFDSKNKNLYRTGFVAAILANDASSKSFYQEKLLALEISDPKKLESKLSADGPLALLKSLD